MFPQRRQHIGIGLAIAGFDEQIQPSRRDWPSRLRSALPHRRVPSAGRAWCHEDGSPRLFRRLPAKLSDRDGRYWSHVPVPHHGRVSIAEIRASNMPVQTSSRRNYTRGVDTRWWPGRSGGIVLTTCRIEPGAVHAATAHRVSIGSIKIKWVRRIGRLTARVVQSGQGDRPSGNGMELEDRSQMPWSSLRTTRTQSVRRLLRRIRKVTFPRFVGTEPVS